MLKPICVKCQRFYRPHRNGVHVLEGKPAHPDVKPGVEQDEHWLPYKLWQSDLWKCQGCEHEIIVGSGRNPMWRDYQGPVPNYTHKVNDC